MFHGHGRRLVEQRSLLGGIFVDMVSGGDVERL